MAGGNIPFEPRLTPDEAYHGFVHPWDEQTSFAKPIRMRDLKSLDLDQQDEGFGTPIDTGGDW